MTRRGLRAVGSGPPVWLGLLAAAYLLVPVALVVTRLGPGHWKGITSHSLWSAAITSVLAATISMGIAALLGVPLGHALARRTGRLWKVIGVAVQLPLALPPLVAGLLLLWLVGPYTTLGEASGRRLTESLIGIVLAQTFVAMPFTVVAARSAFSAVDPNLSLVAATLGHRRLSRFFRVDLAVASPGVRAGLLLTWLRAFGEFGATVMLAYHPYTLPVYTYTAFDGAGIPATYAPVLVSLAIAAVVIVIFQLKVGSWLRAWRPRRRLARVAAPLQLRHGRAAEAVTFSMEARVGSFDLAVAHEGRSGRLAVVGASGAGKSITLQLLAGARTPDRGWVRVGALDLGALRVEERGVGYVPQGGGLVPTLRAGEQATFGMGASPERAAWWIERLGLGGLEERRPAELSGGQAQRLALARALAVSPRLLLLDEPLSAVDTPTRRDLRAELRRVQAESGVPSVIVTHDPEEAAYLADEIIVLDEGRVLQAGPTSTVFRQPRSLAVARLLGVPNVGLGVIAGGELRVGELTLRARHHACVEGEHVMWSVPGEEVEVGGQGQFGGRVADVVDLGNRLEAVIDLDGGVRLTSRHRGVADVGPGSSCFVNLPPVEVWSAGGAAPAGGVGGVAPSAASELSSEGAARR